MANGKIDALCEKPVNFGCINNASSCSPIFSVSEIGDFCRGQFSKLSSGDRDTVMENYCLKHEKSDECKCMNRSLNQDYITLKKNNPFSDACWYTPCANRFQYFVPSDFNKTTKCPQNICQIVYEISKVHDITDHDIVNDINCDFTNSGVIPDPAAIPGWIYICMLVIATTYIFVYSLKKP